MSKLIAGDTQDNEALGGVAAVELVHLSVIPGGRSSEGRHILNEHHLPSQRREAQGFPRQQLGCQLVELLHITSHGQRSFTNGVKDRLVESFLHRSSPHFLQGAGPEVNRILRSVPNASVRKVPIGCAKSHEIASSGSP